jgi:hypothetical protein
MYDSKSLQHPGKLRMHWLIPYEVKTVTDGGDVQLKNLGGIVITLICTRHAYLASCHLRFVLCQNTIEQLFLKIPFLKAHTPCSTIARIYLQFPR